MQLVVEDDELAKEGHIRIYEPVEWFEVVPVDHILGRLPIVPDYGTPTIPHKYSYLRDQAFRKGKADSSVDQHDGSKLYYINHFAMVWSRSKESLVRCYVIHVYCTQPVHALIDSWFA